MISTCRGGRAVILTVCLSLAVVASGRRVYPQTDVQIGYAVISAEEGALPTAAALLSLSDRRGGLVSQTAVPATAPTTDGVLFLDQTATGLALINPSERELEVQLVLREPGGSALSVASLLLEPGRQRIDLVRDIIDVPSDFQYGTLRFSTGDGGGRVGAFAVRQSSNAFGEMILSGLPASPVRRAPGLGEATILPLVSQNLLGEAGVDLRVLTRVVLINPAEEAVSGTLNWTDSLGQPLIADGTPSSVAYRIAAGGVFQAAWTSPATSPTAGYARIVPDPESLLPTASALVEVENADGAPLSETWVQAASATDHARFAIGTGETETALAIVGGELEQEVHFGVADLNGLPVSETSRQLPPESYLALMVDELFDSCQGNRLQDCLPRGHSGVGEIEGQVFPFTFRVALNRHGRPLLSSLPVGDPGRLQSESELIIPQLVVGGGFSTRLILLNGDLDGEATGTIAFADAAGGQLPLPLAGETVSETGYRLNPGGGLWARPGDTTRPAGIELPEQLSDEVTLAMGESTVLRPVVYDTSGRVRDDFPISFSSVSPEFASIDQRGVLEGLKRGFSTLTMTSGDAILVLTATVVERSPGPGFRVTGVRRDSANRLYWSIRDRHSVWVSEEGMFDTAKRYAGVDRRKGRSDASNRLEALFNGPTALDVNGGGDSSTQGLYVSDTDNHSIRRVETTTPDGSVSVVAGDGEAGFQDGLFAQARFDRPRGIALDFSGHLWVADSGNHVIRRLSLSEGTVETIAGLAGSPGEEDGSGSQARFNRPTGLALFPVSEAMQLGGALLGRPPEPTSVLVADSGNGLIRRVYEDGRVETFGSTGSAAVRFAGVPRAGAPRRFDEPVAVTADSLGTVYVAEAGSRQVRAILSDGRLVPIAPAGTFEEPLGLAVLDNGVLAVADGSTQSSVVRFGAAPVIDSVDPPEAPFLGGQVTIMGRNFAPESRVLLAGTEIDRVDVTVRDSTVILVRVPPDLPGGRSNLTVLNRGGTAQTDFLILPPALEELEFGEITTVAGGSTFSGDGSPAESAALRAPGGIAVDAGGNVFLAETGHHRIRRIDAVTGIITTVAGTGVLPENLAEELEDGGPALAAALAFPRGLAFDASGNLFVVEEGSDRVRRIDAVTREITTVAGGGEFLRTDADPEGLGDGGPAVEAVLRAPRGVLVDQDGNLLIADTANHRVRRVRPDGVMETIAGTRQGFGGDGGPAVRARLNAPSALVLDESGNLYIADAFNARIRRVDVDGVITTVVGPPGLAPAGGPVAPALLEPRGLAIGRDGKLLIADRGRHRVWRFDPTTRGLSPLVGTGEAGMSGDGGPALQAALRFPQAITVDGAGLTLISDTGNHRLRRVAPLNGFISTLAGGGEDDFIGDGGLAVAARLRSPVDVALDPDGNLWIADSSNQRVRKVEQADRRISTVAGTGFAGFGGDGGLAGEALLNFPSAIAVDSLGMVWVADTNNDRIRRIDPFSQLIDSVPLPPESLRSPRGVAARTLGDLIVADTDRHRILEFDPRRPFVRTLAGAREAGFIPGTRPARQARFNAPSRLALDRLGNIYVADSLNHAVRKIETSTGFVSTVAGTGQAGFDGDGGPADLATLNLPRGVALDDEGNLYIADSFNHRIRRVDGATRTISTIAGTGDFGFSGDGLPAVLARLNFPSAVALDEAGNLLVADRNNQRVRAIRAGSASMLMGLVALDLTDQPDPVSPGRTLLYRAAATNRSGAELHEFQITVQLPVEVTLDSAFAGDRACDGSAGRVSCDFGTLAARASANAQIQVTVGEETDDTTIFAAAECHYQNQGGSPCRAETATLVRPGDRADLSVVKTGPAGPAVFPDPIRYELTVANGGGAEAEDVVVTDTFPAEFAEFVSAAPPENCREERPGAVRCRLGNLAAGDIRRLTLVLSPKPAIRGGVLTNSARVESSDTDPFPEDNRDSVSNRVEICRGVCLEKTAGKTAVNAGDFLEYSLQLTNNTDMAATNLRVVDELPDQVAWVSSPGCDHNAGRVECLIERLEPRAVRLLNVRVQVDAAAAGPLLNSASCRADQIDTDACEDFVTVDVRPPGCPALTARIEGPTEIQYSPGNQQTFEFRLFVGNDGNTAAEQLTLTYNKPVDPAFEGDSPPINRAVTIQPIMSEYPCQADDLQIICRLGSLPPDGERMVTVRLTPNADIVGRPAVPHEISVEAANDCLAMDASAISATQVFSVAGANGVVPESDLTLSKAGPAIANPGDLIIYSLTVSNAGPTTARRVRITDPLPDGVEYVSSGPNCSYDPGDKTVICQVGTLGNGLSPEIASTAVRSVTVRVLTAGRFDNEASCDSSEPDPDGCSARAVTNDNQPPVAVCRDVTVSAGGSCMTAASVDNGSHDPDGSAVELAQDPPGPYPPGTTIVTLTVTDPFGESDSCTARVSVLDETAPTPDAEVLSAVTGECTAEITQIPTATDNCAGTIHGTTDDPLSYSEQGTFAVVWRFEDGSGNTFTQSQTVIVEDTTAPVPDSPMLAQVSGECMAEVTETPTATDNCAGAVSATTSDPLSYTQPGSYTVNWSYGDGNGNSAQQTQSVVVTDSLPPDIQSVTANPESIWSPRHDFVEVTVDVSDMDNCGGAAVCRIVEVRSSEPVTGKGDNTAPDWEILDDFRVNLRAERSGPGGGRVYTVFVECRDLAGNASVASVEVSVRHDQGNP